MATWTNLSVRPEAPRTADKLSRMTVIVGANQYGKAEVRMATVTRTPDRHELCDLNVGITLSGDLEDVHVTGFVSDYDSIHRARVHIETSIWERIKVNGRPHPHAFRQTGSELRTATAVCESDSEWVISGIQDLVVLKTSGSEFTGFIEDRYTTLQETRDRILSTAVTARWRHLGVEVDWRESFRDARSLLLARFADTHSLSLQQTLYAMASALIEGRPEIVEVRMSMPNRHHFVVDLEPFGLENDNEIFRVEDRPYGLIEASVLQADAPPPGPAWEPYPLL